MPAEDDWRLFHEDESMYGAVLELRRWEPPAPDWDHEHCELCRATFGASADELSEGYVLEDETAAPILPVEERTTYGDGYRYVAAPTNDTWICPDCFKDFRERFGWRAAQSD